MATTPRRILSIAVGALVGWVVIIPLVTACLMIAYAGRMPAHGTMFWVASSVAKAVSGLVSGMLIAAVTWLIGRRPWDGVAACAVAAGLGLIFTLLYAAGVYPTWLAGTGVLSRVPLSYWLLTGLPLVSALAGGAAAALILAKRQPQGRVS